MVDWRLALLRGVVSVVPCLFACCHSVDVACRWAVGQTIVGCRPLSVVLVSAGYLMYIHLFDLTRAHVGLC